MFRFTQLGELKKRGKQNARKQAALLFALACSCTQDFQAQAQADLVVLTLNESLPRISARFSKSVDWPGGVTVLLLHGTLSHRDTEIIQALEQLFYENGLSTLAINLSLDVDNRTSRLGCNDLHSHKVTDAIKELTAWVNWLVAQDATNVLLLGHSRGANQVSRYTADMKNNSITGAVLVAPSQAYPKRAEADYHARYGKDLQPTLQEAYRQSKVGAGDIPMTEHVAFLGCEQALVTANSFISYYAVDPAHDTPSVVSTTSVPTLVVIGSEDTISPDLSERDFGSADVVEIEGADHFFRDLYADDLVDAALRFLQKHTEKGPR